MQTIEYVLSYDDVKEAMLLARKIKPWLMKSVIQATVCLLLIVYFALAVAANPLYTAGYVIITLLTACIGAVLIVPPMLHKISVQKKVTGVLVRLDITDDTITVSTERSENSWEVNRTNVKYVTYGETINLIELLDGQLLAIPKRAITDSAQFEKVATFLNQMD